MNYQNLTVFSSVKLRASLWTLHFGTGISQAASCGQNSHLSFSLESFCSFRWAGEVCIGLPSADEDAWLAAGSFSEPKIEKKVE